MKTLLQNIFAGLTVLTIAACSSNPYKAEKIDTALEKKEALNQEATVGVKDGNVVYQKKMYLGEELRRMQNEVYSLEDRVYGNRKYGSLGLYGVLKQCRMDAVDKKNGGDGKLVWTEPLERVTEKEDNFKFGYDEKDKLIAVSEEFLKDRIDRFRNYRNVLEKRQDEYEEKISICQVEMKSKKHDADKATAAAPADVQK